MAGRSSSSFLTFVEVLDYQLTLIYISSYQNVHAIGDRAGHAVLDGFAASPEAVRPRLEHAQILTPDDLQRVVDLGGESSISKRTSKLSR